MHVYFQSFLMYLQFSADEKLNKVPQEQVRPFISIRNSNEIPVNY